jgi:chromosome segregation and condensation protein ScpB
MKSPAAGNRQPRAAFDSSIYVVRHYVPRQNRRYQTKTTKRLMKPYRDRSINLSATGSSTVRQYRQVPANFMNRYRADGSTLHRLRRACRGGGALW